MKILPLIAEHIRSLTGEVNSALSVTPVSGGDINQCYRLDGFNKPYFIKQNQARLLPMFEAEMAGLTAIANTQTLKVPIPLLCATAGDKAFLVMEFVNFGKPSTSAWALLGEQLATLHQQPQAYFGWFRDNTIGSTPQLNSQQADWLVFWCENRLKFQWQRAAQRGFSGQLQDKAERLCALLPALFVGYRPQPALLHGDLWGGNVGFDSQGAPIIYDPACYFGDREADLAMTELFGGFNPIFYQAYQTTWPLDGGYTVRKILYNLYHILNHVNLFGRAYLNSAETMIDQLLAELS